ASSPGRRCRHCPTPLPSGWGPVACPGCGHETCFTPMHLAWVREEGDPPRRQPVRRSHRVETLSARASLPAPPLDVNEAAALLAVKPDTLYQWAYQRRIPVVKLMGRALRFRLSEIERLITQGARPALGARSHRNP